MEGNTVLNIIHIFQIGLFIIYISTKVVCVCASQKKAILLGYPLHVLKFGVKSCRPGKGLQKSGSLFVLLLKNKVPISNILSIYT